MFLKSTKLGLAAAVVGLLTASAKAAVVISLSLVVTPDPVDNQTAGVTGTWQAYATITQDAATTGGLSTVAIQMVPTGGVSIVNNSGITDAATGLPAITVADLPNGTIFSTTPKLNGGFSALNVVSEDGMTISQGQNPTAVTSVTRSGVTYYSVLAGIGKSAGSAGFLAWDNPVLVADGYYYDNGQGGTLQVAQTADGTSGWLMLPTTITTGSIAGGCFAPGSVLSSDAVQIGSAPVDTPEPASLGVLALGGMALLARRRKVA